MPNPIMSSNLYFSNLYLSCECFCHQSFQPVNYCNIIGGEKSLQATVMKLLPSLSTLSPQTIVSVTSTYSLGHSFGHHDSIIKIVEALLSSSSSSLLLLLN